MCASEGSHLLLKYRCAAFEKLSTSFQRLNDTAMYLGDLADMSKASKDFTNNTKDAAIRRVLKIAVEAVSARTS
jgi:hypothetical protein